MKMIFAVLAGTLVLAAASAENTEGHEALRQHPEKARPVKGDRDTPRPPTARPQGPPAAQSTGTPDRQRSDRRGPERRGNDSDHGYRDRGGPPQNDLRMNRRGDFDHVGPDRRRRPDFGRFQGNYHAQRRFHAEPWHPPRDYRYRRWTYGERLPSLYFSPGLWIGSFALYGLMAPPPDTVWVRSGPDALLVDRDTGEIIRVEYNVFY